MPNKPLPPNADEDPQEFNWMVTGTHPYTYRDAYISRLAKRGREQVKAINNEQDEQKRSELLKEFLDCDADAEVHLLLPFFAEYGFNIKCGTDVVLGTGTTILDVAPVEIGDRTMLGPNVQIYTPIHPVHPEARNGTRGREGAKPITIGSDCWIGGSAVICPGVTIGNGSTIGAGSVVTKSIPERSVAVGNPAKVIKTLDYLSDQELEIGKV
ncbi:maltose o-acetyltransferase [Phaffia rhodozyma]|uniref:Maltose o-acetyltransferase n=1 Tax=Phaffia rhodozyma TaxID=264483 RepID=A0A0F7SPN8_PHARH|nr:maltose o-acetyltransferase [Phaffia rhodozyma]